MTQAEFKAKIIAKYAKKRKPRRNREHELQKACVKLFRLKYPALRRLLFSIPNGAMLAGRTKIDRAKQWNKLEAEGAQAGAADLFLSVPSGDLAGLYIEMKTPKGRQQANQKEFETAVVEQGYGYAIPRSTKEFENVIDKYLKTGEY